SRYASEQLAQVFPHTKLILLLRNPIDRAISNYHMQVRLGRQNSPLETVLLSELDFINTHSEAEWLDSMIRSNSIFRGLYLRHLQQWLQYFPRDKFLILRSEDFFINPAKTVDQTFQFLGVESHQLSSYPIQNQGYYEAAPLSIRQALSDFFQPHNQALEQFLGQQFNWN
ncbi:sulfotransferase domain-containing protein, partial [Nostoc sp.]